MLELEKLLDVTQAVLVRRVDGCSYTLDSLPPDLDVRGIAPLDSACSSDLSFITNARFKPQLLSSQAM